MPAQKFYGPAAFPINGLHWLRKMPGVTFASHALEHEIGGLFDVAHGAGLAAI